jgi:prepilin-type N-terminal cleavage/methylation domain-containing protein/prepilin-type processing-associated H-X9-DG protein
MTRRTDSIAFSCRFPAPSAGFTLVEMLVVVGVVSVLVGLLMPAVHKARRSAEQVACLANIRQVTFGFFAYSLDNKVIPGSLWQGELAASTPGAPVNLDWGGRNNQLYVSNPSAYSHPLQTSVLLKYIGTDRVLTCPTGGRPNQFFDYTMVMRLAGAKTNLRWRMSYPVHPEQANSARKYFPAIPLMIEENQWFYNSPIDDGAYSNLDQFSHRHNNGCNVGYLDGSAGWFRAPHGPTPDGITTAQDLCANDLLLEAPSGSFPVGHSSPGEFGWANNPQ